VTKNLPRVIHSSLSIVLCIFLLTVTSYFVVLAPQLVAQTNTVALDFGSAIAGTVGGVVFACLVAFSCLGALNGQFYTSARFVFTAGKEGYLPKMFGRTNARTKTPVAATALQAALVIVFILFGSGFASLVNFYGVCSWSGYLFTVLGLLVLRIKEPHLERPYQTWITTPILFSAVALFLLFMPIFSAPLEGTLLSRAAH
jgi:amino acid transporter